jgi:hypothetical protein
VEIVIEATEDTPVPAGAGWRAGTLPDGRTVQLLIRAVPAA